MIEKSNSDSHPLNSIVHEIKSTKQNSALQKVQAADSSLQDHSVISLTTHAMQAPAFLLDHEMRLVWQNQSASADLWDHVQTLSPGKEILNIFDILLDTSFQAKVQNWRQWVAFFLQHAKGMMSVSSLNDLIGTFEERKKGVLEEMLADTGPALRYTVFSGRMRQFDSSGYHTTFWVVATDFKEGRFFVFDPALAQTTETGTARAADIEQKMEMVRQNVQPAQKVVHVLAARLHNADILRTEMLADEYSRLLSRILQKTVETIEHFSGIIGQFDGKGIWGYFIPVNQSEQDPFYVIDCALELKAKMMELGREWKIRKGWLHDIELNLGIHSGYECLGMLHSSLGDNLATFGDTLQIASFLSDMGHSGEIWTTKDFINKLPPENHKRLRFGIFREDNNRQVFIARCFSRIKDLSGMLKRFSDAEGDLGSLAVTQIFDQQRS